MLVTAEHNGSLRDGTAQLINKFLGDKTFYWPSADRSSNLVHLIGSEFRQEVCDVFVSSVWCKLADQLATSSPMADLKSQCRPT